MNENVFLFYNSPVMESFQTTELIHIYFSSLDLGEKKKSIFNILQTRLCISQASFPMYMYKF